MVGSGGSLHRRPTIETIGSIFVLLVVVLVPAFLGALSNSTLPADAQLTTADASATALHSLDRELQNKELAPTAALAAGPAWWNAALPTPNDLAHGDVPCATTTSTTVAIEPARLL